MAINPNTDFTAGAVLTAAQQNRFPRGIMAYTSSTTTDTSVTTEEVEFTLTWTAVANRYYKISWLEPDVGISGAGATALFWRFRQTNITGTVLGSGYLWIPSSSVDNTGHFAHIGTFSAGSTTVVCTGAASGATIQLNRGTGKAAFAWVEDIGPS